MTNHEEACRCIRRASKLFSQHQRPDDETIEIYAEVLRAYSTKDIINGFSALMRKGIKFFPSCSEILAVVDPEPSESDQDDYMAGEIIESLSRFGSYQPKEARDYLGEKAWRAIGYMGGWAAMCCGNERDLGMVRAQLRKAIRGSSAALSGHKLIESAGIGKNISYSETKLVELEKGS